MAYFEELPNILYPNLLRNQNKIEDRIPVKNIFKRAKLRDDVDQAITAFNYYYVEQGMRPDMVAKDLYGDSELDWVVLTTNNITNYRDQWPLNSVDFQNYIIEKYGSEEALTNVHHYNTELFMDQRGRLIVPEGLRVDSNFDSRYLDEVLQTEITMAGETLNPITSVDGVGVVKDADGNQVLSSNVFPVTNYQYEVNENDAKRRIRVLKSDYLDIYLADMRRIMKYKKSSDYLTKRLKKVYNPRLSGA